MRYIIVGNGIAGITAADTLAQAEAQIEIYSEEAYPYYPRPRLHALLAGETALESIFTYPAQWYHERGIELHLNVPVTSVTPARKEIVTAHGERRKYDRLLLAPGSHPKVPPMKGVEKVGVFTLRTIADALAIRRHARGLNQAIVIGAGLLGLEAAKSLRSLGLEVKVLESSMWLLPRQLDREGSPILLRRIQQMGIEVITGVGCESVLGGKKASGVLLQDGRRIEGGLVLISTGIEPDIRVAAQAGIHVNKGILVDNYLATSAQDIYAAGDTAEHLGKIYGIIPAAIEQAKAAAKNMLEPGSLEYKGTLPRNNLNIMGIDLTSMGVISPDEQGYQEVREVDEEEGVYKKLVLKRGRLMGFILLGEKKTVLPLARLMREGKDISPYVPQILKRDFDWTNMEGGQNTEERHGSTK